MPIHKFIYKHRRQSSSEPSVLYRPHRDLRYPSTLRNGKWEVYVQKSVNVKPRSSLTLVLGFGVLIRRCGTVLVSLKQDLKVKHLSLQDGVVSETVDDIIITICNNSDDAVTMNAGDSLCFVGTL